MTNNIYRLCITLGGGLLKKKKGKRLYYYLVESARVDGKPRIVHQAYLGTAEKLAELVQQRSAPIPISATLRDCGLPGASWLAVQQSGLWPLLESLWPAPRSGPSPAHYLLLAAIHRICNPGPKTEVSSWYDQTILVSEWSFPAERFTSQAFWEAFEQILPETIETHAPAEVLSSPAANELTLNLRDDTGNTDRCDDIPTNARPSAHSKPGAWSRPCELSILSVQQSECGRRHGFLPVISQPVWVKFNLNATFYIKLTGNLSWNVSLNGNYDRRPPNGLSGSDYGSSSGLSWTFGNK